MREKCFWACSRKERWQEQNYYKFTGLIMPYNYSIISFYGKTW